MAQGPSGSQREPESVGALLKMMGERLLKGLPMRIAVVVVLFPVIWALHTYLLVVVNEGFNRDTGSWKGALLAQILALQGRQVGGAAFWFALSLLAGALIGGIARDASGFFAGQGKVFGRISAGFRGGSAALAAVMGGAGAGLLVVSAMNGRFVALIFAVLAWLSLAEGPTGFSRIVMRCVYNDVRKVLGKPRRRLPDARGDGFVAGFMLGCAAYAVLFLIPWYVFLVLAVGMFVTSVVLAAQGPATAVSHVSVLLVALAVCATCMTGIAVADDGGASEATGPWILSQGAAQAIAMGVPPALAGAVGAIIGLLGPTLGAAFVKGILPGLTGSPTGGGAGIRGGDGPAKCQGGLPNWWVDPATLRLGISDTIESWDGAGPGVSLTLSWGSEPGRTGTFGPGWRFAYDGDVTSADGVLYARFGNRVAGFAAPDAPAVAGQPAVAQELSGAGRLVNYGATWVWEDASGAKVRYDTVGAAIVLTAASDTCGTEVSVARDAYGRITSVADAQGRAATLEYDASGRCAGIRMPDGRRATVAYGPDGRLAQVVDCAGVETVYTYEAAGMVAAITVGRDRRTTSVRWAAGPDGAPVVAALVDAAGGSTRYEMVSAEPRVVRVWDPEDRCTTCSYEGGRLVESTDPCGAVTRMTYEEDRLVAASGPRGSVAIAYDERGLPVAETDAAGLVTRFGYDEAGNCVARVMPDGSVWRYAYDARRNMVSRTSPAGRMATMTYDDRGLLTSYADGGGGAARFEHDRFGNVVAVTDAAGAVSRVEYDSAGLRPVKTIDPLGNETAVEYDENGRIVRTQHADGSVETAIYDCCTQRGLTDEDGVTSGVDRDAMMRPVATTDASGTERMTYDRSGQLVSVGDPAAPEMRFERDACGRTTRIVRADGSAVVTTTDAGGRLVGFTTPAGHSVRIDRDASGRSVRVTDGAGAVTESGRDALGRLVWVRNARGHVVQLAYDADGLPVSKSVNGQVASGLEYGPAGQVTGLTGPGAVRYALDAAGRITGFAYQDSTAADFVLDAAGNVVKMIMPGGLEVAYTYDARGRMTRAEFAGSSVEWTYSPAGRLLSETRSNGTATEYEWAKGGLGRIAHARSGRAFYDVTWQVADDGRAVSAEGVRAAGPAKAPDHSLAHGGSGRVVSADGRTVAYDPDGNVTAMAGAYELVHDPENRVAAVVTEGGTTGYAYDAFGRAARREGPAGTVVYHRDGAGRVLYETDETGAVLASHVWRAGVLVATVRRDGVRFYHGDRVMNVVAVTDGDGEVVAAYDYDAFGEITAQVGDGADQPFLFVGMAGATAQPGGLYAMGRRFYDPVMRQFLERDPAGYRGSLEPYEYAEGQPVNVFDASGFEGVGQPQLSGYLTGNYSGPPVAEVQLPSGMSPHYGPGATMVNGPAPFSPPSPGGGKMLSGLLNFGAGTYGTYAKGALLYGAYMGTATLTPAGLIWAGVLFAGSIGRIYAGIKNYRQGLNGEEFPSNTDAVVETADPGGIRTWPGRFVDTVCSMGSMMKDGARAIGRKFDHVQEMINNFDNPDYPWPGPAEQYEMP